MRADCRWAVRILMKCVAESELLLLRIACSQLHGFVIWVDEDACPIGRRLLYRFCMHLSACVCLRARFGDNVLLRVFVCVRVCVLNSLVLR